MRDGQETGGGSLGKLLARAPLPVKDLLEKDDQDSPEWLLRLEFAVVALIFAFGFFTTLYMAFASASASAHPGGLAADGCHNDRKNGGRHCHGAKASAPSSSRPQALRGTAYFPNCAAARAAGAAPVRRGDAGYGSHLDRDGDGIGCE